MKLIQILSCAACFSASALPAASHPHIFVDTALRILTDEQGRATGVEVYWAYDDLYSLLILEDMELDADYDGKLTEDELSRLHGFDMQWDAGFDGDLYASGPQGALTMTAPTPLDTHLLNGKIITRHVRRFPSPQTEIVIKAYDPTFYTAYDMTGGITAPDGCQITRHAADMDAAYALVEEKMTQKAYAEDDYPEVGEAFADTITVTCNGGS
ncbi:DUF1007 family protein [Thalassovita sp.]|uniref:DUF1007 family protein n=1 Tax=Thalassovita sp. TaxID=1979401 RepID=UPI00288203A6|nr:DUF1007 family protein [Thalassovita sp.]MDF1801843.1 DUF1007 family protein [Thalassovita sp.]